MVKKKDLIKNSAHKCESFSRLMWNFFSQYQARRQKTLKKLYGPFLWMEFNCLKAKATSRRQFTFYHSFARNSWFSFYQPRKDERLSQPQSHPVVLNTGPLDWESSALTTRPKASKQLDSSFPFSDF